jgi:nucleoside-diphosphate-sugar epimerase
MSELHVVLGAGGNIGTAVVHELVNRGKSVRGVSRSGRAELPGTVQQAAADAQDRESLAAAVKGAAVVYHCIGVPYRQWSRTYPAVMRNLVAVAADLDRRHSFIFLPDFARFLVNMATDGRAYGQVWILPHMEVLTIGSLLSSMIREVREVAYQTQIDWVVDWSKYRDVFGGQPTPIEQALHETLAWYRQQPDAVTEGIVGNGFQHRSRYTRRLLSVPLTGGG